MEAFLILTALVALLLLRTPVAFALGRLLRRDRRDHRHRRHSGNGGARV